MRFAFRICQGYCRHLAREFEAVRRGDRPPPVSEADIYVFLFFLFSSYDLFCMYTAGVSIIVYLLQCDTYR